MLKLLLCLVWTLTEPCKDDRLRWIGPAVELTWNEEMLVSEPGALIGCFEGTIRVWNPAMPEEEGVNPLFIWWDGDPGRLMDFSNHRCDLVCRRCIAWEEGRCIESEPIPGKTCCPGRMCDL